MFRCTKLVQSVSFRKNDAFSGLGLTNSENHAHAKKVGQGHPCVCSRADHTDSNSPNIKSKLNLTLLHAMSEFGLSDHEDRHWNENVWLENFREHKKNEKFGRVWGL